MSVRAVALLLAACAAALPAAAQQAAPLTLAEALAAVDVPHPDLRLAEAERERARAEELAARGPADWTVSVEAGLRKSDPASDLPGADPWLDDNTVKLLVRRNLLDFGRTGRALEGAQHETAAREAGLIGVRAARRIEIMERFFDVLLTDLRYTAENEFMAVAFVEFDHARERHQVGDISAVELARIEASYVDRLERRNESRARQRATRSRLAQAMNRPGQLASDLAPPALPDNDRPLPPLEALQAAVLERNPRMAAARLQLQASQSRLAALRLEHGPTVDLQLEAGGFSDPRGGRDNNLSAGLVLNWPLYQGARLSSRIAREQAEFQRLQAAADKLAMELQQALLELWLEAGQLQSTTRNAARRNSAWRELALERARGEYEVELKTNLGTSMAETMSALLRERRTDYRLALALARLEALAGQPLAALAPPADRAPVAGQ